ncbi:MAG: enoyl-CoA hydratase-related protein [Oceanococcaceae bacterium]
MTDLPTTSALELHLSGYWLQIRLNQPERRNCLSPAMVTELRQVFDWLPQQRAIRGVSLRGNGGMFCAGGDLREFQRIAEAGDTAHDMATAMSLEIATLLRQIAQLPQLTVALLEGAAMAGGFGVACATDIVVATPDCRFALTETRIGITPAQIAPYVIPRVGLSRGRRLLLLGGQFRGDAAHTMGIVDELATDGDDLARIEAGLREELRMAAPGGVAATKRVIQLHSDQALDDFIAPAAALFADCLVSPEGQEGFHSFLDKVPPSWQRVEPE